MALENAKFQLLIEVLERFFTVPMRGWFFGGFKKSAFLKVLILGVQNKRGFCEKLCTLMLFFTKGAFFCRALLRCFLRFSKMHLVVGSAFWKQKVEFQPPVEIISSLKTARGPG